MSTCNMPCIDKAGRMEYLGKTISMTAIRKELLMNLVPWTKNHGDGPYHHKGPSHTSEMRYCGSHLFHQQKQAGWLGRSSPYAS